MQIFQQPEAAKDGIRELFGEAVLRWGDAVPVTFTEASDNWDFEITMSSADNCTVNGCTLARAFFPDGGRHDLMLYPILFQQPVEEQVETFIHELGHVFGLRHFFANVSETAFPSEIFWTHNKFSIMNYGAESVLTEDDKSDLKRLYQKVWSGELTEINGTPVVQFRPFHEAVTGAPSPTAARVGCEFASRDAAEDAMRALLIEFLRRPC